MVREFRRKIETRCSNRFIGLKVREAVILVEVGWVLLSSISFAKRMGGKSNYPKAMQAERMHA